LHFACHRYRTFAARRSHDEGRFSKMKILTLTACSTTAIALLGLSACVTPTLSINPVNASALSQQTPSAKVDVLYAQGREALIAGDLASALELFHGARRAGPEDVRVLNGLAVIYDRLGRFDLSANYYDRARDLDPGSPVLQANLALSNDMRARQAQPTSRQVAQRAAEMVPATQDKPNWEETPTPKVEVVSTIGAEQQTQGARISYDNPNQMETSPQHHMPEAVTESLKTVAALPLVPAVPERAIRVAAITSATPSPTSAKPDWLRPAVIVINGSGVRGQARLTASHLRETGWVVVRVGNELPFQRTTTLILYGPSQRQQALMIGSVIKAQFRHEPTFVPVLGNGQIQVRLGRDTVAANQNKRRQT
jgi:hypothetical protein